MAKKVPSKYSLRKRLLKLENLELLNFVTDWICIDTFGKPIQKYF